MNFIESNSNGTTFFRRVFLSNLSNILVIPFRNYTLFYYSFSSMDSKYFIAFNNGSLNQTLPTVSMMLDLYLGKLGLTKDLKANSKSPSKQEK